MDSVFKNTSIWESSMTPSQVFSAWTSMLYSRDLEAESDSEEDVRLESEPNTKSANKKLCNGSERNTTELSITDSYI